MGDRHHPWKSHRLGLSLVIALLRNGTCIKCVSISRRITQWIRKGSQAYLLSLAQNLFQSESSVITWFEAYLLSMTQNLFQSGFEPIANWLRMRCSPGLLYRRASLHTGQDALWRHELLRKSSQVKVMTFMTSQGWAGAEAGTSHCWLGWYLDRSFIIQV